MVCDAYIKSNLLSIIHIVAKAKIAKIVMHGSLSSHMTMIPAQLKETEQFDAEIPRMVLP